MITDDQIRALLAAWRNTDLAPGEDMISVGRQALEAHAVAQGDPVDHPAHYTGHPSGVECITITEHMGFNLGNAVKYVWRADLKHDSVEDLRKAAWYLDREIARRTREPA